jgi:Mn-dependent DtxR family transcriptional regulator
VPALPDREADAAACRMKHVPASAVVDRFWAFADFVHGDPLRAAGWVDGMGRDRSLGPDAGRRQKGARAC